MKQIILITDGCSNVGISPVAAAAQAKEEGIVVNVIGIVGGGLTDEYGIAEIQDIAGAGGGMSRLVTPDQLSRTVQMMTRQTVMQTIQQAVGQELRGIIGTSRLEALPPEQRSEVVRVIDELSETSELQVALLIDASASMKPKLQAVKEALYDLQLSLQARAGKSRMAVFHFPGNVSGDEPVKLDLGWTSDLANLGRLFYKLNMRGATPTGPALIRVVQYYRESAGIAGNDDSAHRQEEAAGGLNTMPAHGDGMLSDYIV